MARRENDLVIKHAGYQNGEEKIIIDAIFDNMSAAFWPDAQHHTHAHVNTKDRPCLSSISLHIPLRRCLSAGQLSDYCVGTDCE